MAAQAGRGPRCSALHGLTLTRIASSMSRQYINADNALSVPGPSMVDLGVRYALRVADRKWRTRRTGPGRFPAAPAHRIPSSCPPTPILDGIRSQRLSQQHY